MFPQGHNAHRPPHVFHNEMIYFITARCITPQGGVTPVTRNDSALRCYQAKKIFQKCLKIFLAKYEISLYAWVILDDHYHLLLKFKNAEDLAKFVNQLHSMTARLFNKLYKTLGRKIWYQYFDHCIRNETDFWKHFNYIHQNPIKHGLRKNLAGVFNYPFSSAKSWSKIKGEEWFNSCFEFYPIIDFTAME
jgi:putative transposase